MPSATQEPSSATATSRQVHIINGKKTFIPLENNPETISHLSTLLSVQNLSYHDVFSLTEPSLVALIPRPVHAIILIAPANIYNAVRASDHPIPSSLTGATPPFPFSGPTSPIVWFKQTIGHACGLIAWLHALANGPARAHVTPGSPLDTFFLDAADAEPAERAQLLYDNEALEKAHMTAAAEGQSYAPDPREHCGMHYICFVKGEDGRLWELEGGWDGPIERGQLLEGEDVLCEKAVAMGPGRFLDEGRKLGEAMFSCVAVVEEKEG